jgi:hypothetical protein
MLWVTDLQGWIKKFNDSCYTRTQTLYFKCSWHISQRAVIFAVIWLEAYEWIEHNCGSSARRPTWKIRRASESKDLYLWARKLSVAHNHREHVELYGIDVVSGQQVGKGCSTFASGRRNKTDAIDVDGKAPHWNKWTLYPSRNSFRRAGVQLFATFGTWPWFILRYSVANGGGSVVVECVWNVMAHGDAREKKQWGNWRMEWVASKRHMAAEHRVAWAVQTLQADVYSSPSSSRLNWLPRRFKWTRPLRRKTKSGFCACAITFQTQSTKMERKMTCFYYLQHYAV